MVYSSFLGMCRNRLRGSQESVGVFQSLCSRKYLIPQPFLLSLLVSLLFAPIVVFAWTVVNFTFAFKCVLQNAESCGRAPSWENKRQLSALFLQGPTRQAQTMTIPSE